MPSHNHIDTLPIELMMSACCESVGRFTKDSLFQSQAHSVGLSDNQDLSRCIGSVPVSKMLCVIMIVRENATETTKEIHDQKWNPSVWWIQRMPIKIVKNCCNGSHPSCSVCDSSGKRHRRFSIHVQRSTPRNRVSGEFSAFDCNGSHPSCSVCDSSGKRQRRFSVYKDRHREIGYQENLVHLTPYPLIDSPLDSRGWLSLVPNRESWLKIWIESLTLWLTAPRFARFGNKGINCWIRLNSPDRDKGSDSYRYELGSDICKIANC